MQVKKRRPEKQNPFIFIIAAIILVVIACILVTLYMPSREVKKLTDYYPVEDGQVLLIMEDYVYEKKGLFIDGHVYIDYETAKSFFNKRFYWDANENLMIYTTATQLIKASVGSKDFYINKSKDSVDYQIVKTEGDQAYIAIDFIEKYSGLKSRYYENPSRMVFTYRWDEMFQSSEVRKNTSLREEGSIKSPIVAELEKGSKVRHLEMTEEEKGKAKGFVKAITADGVIGYVQEKRLSKAEEIKNTTDYEEPSYPSITKEDPINLVWHQVTNQDANNGLLNLLDATKGVNVISPTWFAISSTEGNITSLASETYVSRAHGAGVEVWALCNDFDTDNVNISKLLSHTSRREKLENSLIAEAIKFNLDGINIDFEKIPEAAGEDFIQFIRELSIKCRSNGIVLSIDNYAPGYTAHYDRREQGMVADYVITMAYDEHYAGSKESGSVASIGYVEEAITNTLKEVPPEKAIIAIPFYTRLWKETKEDGETKVSSEAYSMTNAENLMADHEVTPEWDKETGQYYGEYEEGDALFRMWMEEDQSIELKMKAIKEAKVAGVAAWKLGLEKASVWDVILKYVN